MSENKVKEESNLFEGENVDLTSPAKIIPIDDSDPAVLGNAIPTEGISQIRINSYVDEPTTTASPLLQQERPVDAILAPETTEAKEDTQEEYAPEEVINSSIEAEGEVDEDGHVLNDGLDGFRAELQEAIEDTEEEAEPVEEDSEPAYSIMGAYPRDEESVEEAVTPLVKEGPFENVDVKEEEIKATTAPDPIKKEDAIEEEELSLEDEIAAELGTDNEDEEDIATDIEDDDQVYQDFLTDIGEKLHLPAKEIDISNFKIGNPISATSVLSTMNSGKSIDSSDWALHSTEIPITMRKFTGVELKNLQAVSTARRNRQNAIFERWNLIYEHDTNPNKPKDVQEWAKRINAKDENDIFFAVYDATFHNANHIPYTCKNPKCRHAFISEHIPTSKMVKFEPEEFRAEFESIRAQGPSDMKNRKVIKRGPIPISKNFAVTTKDASIWDINFMFRLVGEEFFNKYIDTIEVIGYIDDLFKINYQNGTVDPIQYKKDEGKDDANTAANVKNRIIIYNRIIKQLTPDEYGTLVSVTKEPDDANKVIYVLPECTCPKCGELIPERELNGSRENGTIEGQLFTRRPLAIIANI